jgi:hypothetical protein
VAQGPGAGRRGSRGLTCVPGSAAAPWEPWVDELADALGDLDDGAALLVTAPEAAARPVALRRPRLRGFLPGRYRRVAPWVRLQRTDQHLRGWCVGSEAVAGAFPLAPDDHAALLALGWHPPPPREGTDYTRWWPDDVPTGPYLPAADARRAAEVVADTFRTVLACAVDDDSALALPRGRTGWHPQAVLRSAAQEDDSAGSAPVTSMVTRRFSRVTRAGQVADLSCWRAGTRAGPSAPSSDHL